MNNQTQEALKMAIDEIQDLMQHIKDKQPDMLFTGSEYVINACKEALATTEDSSVVQPVQEPIYIYDLEAIAWALDKLANFGVTNNSADNALMADRLQMMLYQAPLEQPAQDPVLIQWYDEEEEEWENTDERYYKHYQEDGHKIRFLYTHPAQPCEECENLKHDLEGYMNANKELIDKEWQELTDEDIARLILINKVDGTGDVGFARLVEQASRIKNHG